MSASWRALVEQELGGKSFEEALVTRLREGIDVQPVYSGPLPPDAAGFPGMPPYTRGARLDAASWRRTQRYRAEELDAIAADVAGGTDGLWLEGPLDHARALEGLDLKTLSIASDEPDALLTALGDRRPAELLLALDPFAPGRSTAQLAALLARAPDARTRTVLISSVPHHRAGADAVTELGLSLAMAAEALRALGVEAASRFAFAFAVGTDVFLEIAKLRAARLAWARMLEASGLPEPPPMWIHAETSRRMLTKVDAWTNMLRVSGAAFAAAVGGADSISTSPYDEAIGVPEALGRRVARNTQLVLAEEAMIGSVIDPAGGSYYVESLTRELAARAWKVLQEVEAAGGAERERDRGALARRVELRAAERRAAIASRRLPITGVSEVASPEAPPARAPWAPAPPSALPPMRDAEAFESLRARASGSVYLALLGPPREHAAREGFARGAFGVLGVPIEAGPVEAARGPIACLCGSDEAYEREGAEAIRALRARGATRVVLAGKRGPEVDAKIFKGCDLLAALGGLYP